MKSFSARETCGLSWASLNQKNLRFSALETCKFLCFELGISQSEKFEIFFLRFLLFILVGLTWTSVNLSISRFSAEFPALGS